jgi:cell division protease FtsH
LITFPPVPPDDLARISDIARSMVTRYGMDERYWPHCLMRTAGQSHLGQNFSGSAARNSMSDKTAEHIDSAIKSIVDNIYDKSHDILI